MNTTRFTIPTEIMYTLSDIFDYVTSNEKVGPAIIMVLAALCVASLVMGLLPQAVGSSVLGILAGRAFILEFTNNQKRSSSRTRQTSKVRTVEKKPLPYEEWPDYCHSCGTELDEDMRRRGQFVVQRGDESGDDMLSVGLCRECARTYATLLDTNLIGLNLDDRPDE